jgi:hypothetical protein
MMNLKNLLILLKTKYFPSSTKRARLSNSVAQL